MTAGFEPDIIEYWGGEGHNAVHWGGYGSCHQWRDQGGGLAAADDFHIWGMLYDPLNGVTFYRDGRETWSYNAGCSASTPCTVPLYVKFNNNMQGCCDNSQPMQVDWFRFYTKP
jgi:hypothetical protein